jgi:pyruvate kinase
MLESMKDRPRPTRAEAVDVANAVLDGADGLVLSGETAIGKYPLQSLAMMCQICAEAENSMDYDELQSKAIRRIQKPILVEESIASSAVRCAREVNAKLIIVVTENGKTSRLVAKYRPNIPVLTITWNLFIARQLTLCNSVLPLFTGQWMTEEDALSWAIARAMEMGYAQEGDIVVLTYGSNPHSYYESSSGTTTKLQVSICTKEGALNGPYPLRYQKK